MQRGIGALGETVARFDTIEATTVRSDTVEATTVRFDDDTTQSTNSAFQIELQLYETDVVGNEATALGVALNGMQSGKIRFYSWRTDNGVGYDRQLGIAVKDASGTVWSKQVLTDLTQAAPPPNGAA